jgi:succinate dehydrogenase hydrophobic anchor subunit
MQHLLIKFVDLLIMLCIFYHAGYGLLSVSKDYLQSKALRQATAGVIVVLMIVLGWFGIRLTLFI